MIGKTVYLRPLEKDDMEGVYQSTQDEEIRYMTGTRDTFTMAQLYEHYDRISNDDTRYDFAICLIEGDHLLGDLSVLEIDLNNRKAGFRIAFHDRKFLNKGYGTEATRLALRFTFGELKLNRLQLEVFSHNIRGIRAYEKVGFKREGVLRQSLFLSNRYSDEIVMGMLHSDYSQVKRGPHIGF